MIQQIPVYPASNINDGSTGTYIETNGAYAHIIFDLTNSVLIRYFKIFISGVDQPGGVILVGDQGDTTDAYCCPVPLINSVNMWFNFECDEFLTGRYISLRVDGPSNVNAKIHELDVYIDV